MIFTSSISQLRFCGLANFSSTIAQSLPEAAMSSRNRSAEDGDGVSNSIADGSSTMITAGSILDLDHSRRCITHAYGHTFLNGRAPADTDRLASSSAD